MLRVQQKKQEVLFREREEAVGLLATAETTIKQLEKRQVPERLNCYICLEGVCDGVVTQCGHPFCESCFEFWYQQSRSCPACRAFLHDSHKKVFIKVHEIK